MTDLLHENSDGDWVQKVSSYQKVRIHPQDLGEIIEKIGFSILSHSPINRVQVLAAEKI